MKLIRPKENLFQLSQQGHLDRCEKTTDGAEVNDDVATDEQESDDGHLASDDAKDGENGLCCMKHGFYEEASVAAMVKRLWSWAVTTKTSGSILSLTWSLFQIRVRTTTASEMSGSMLTRPVYSFKSSGEAIIQQ